MANVKVGDWVTYARWQEIDKRLLDRSVSEMVWIGIVTKVSDQRATFSFIYLNEPDRWYNKGDHSDLQVVIPNQKILLSYMKWLTREGHKHGKV